MKVILKPVSHPQLGEISIAGELFAIGRNEEPFASGLGATAMRLSRRHARIFEEDGKVFVADLGSLNGTRLNEKPLKNGAAALRSNDLVTFGDEISFRVEIRREEQRTVARLPPVRLTLVPVDPASGLETLTIERFPFLVARVDSTFEQYKDSLPDALRKLSRRHAVIALKGDRVYVEDLGSFNGTYVGGQKLDERARQLANGDTVMFGSPQLSYRVRVQTQEEPAPFAATMIAPPAGTVAAMADAPQPAPVQADSMRADPIRAEPMPADASPAEASRVEAMQPDAVVSQPGNRTRFVSSADSFINVFCADNQEQEAAAPNRDVAETMKAQVLKAPGGPLERMRAMAGEFWRALRGQSHIDRKVAWIAVAVVVVTVTAVGGSYLLGTDRREIKALLDDGKYSESARTANRYLARHPEDQQAAGLAEEALTKALVPAWIQYVDAGHFDQAASHLRTQSESYRSIQHSKQLIDTLAWAGKVQAHMADRGPSGRIVMFRHEEPIRTLVAEWEADSFRRQQLMDQIVTRVPAFEHIHSRVFSSLRTLRSDNALYVKAMEQLDSAVRAALKKNDRPAVDRLLSDFATDYAHVGGLDVLKEDLVRYDALTLLVQQKELLELVRVSRSTKFRTPIFASYVDEWLGRSLPPQDVISRHAEAAAAWRAGHHQDAITILEPLARGATPDSWGEVAARQIARYRKVETDYEDLLASRQSEGYWGKLLLVWSSLRPNEDDHLMRALEPDFLAHREQVTPRLDESMRRVQGYWNEYRNAGGIPGVVRVEERVSERFAGQAKRLSKAYDEITSGARTYQLLQVTPSDEWQSLQEQVVNEVQRQRRSLQDLNIVLEPALLRAKLALLPQAQEQSLWVRSTTNPNRD